TSVENSSFAGMPSTQQCMTCHSQIVQGIPDIETLAVSLNTNTPISWVRVDQLPDYVYFDHSAHVDGGIACETCHGRVDEMSVVYKTQSMSMQWCVSCHSNPQPNVRPEDAVFTMGWQPTAADQQAERIYTAIETQHLINCDVCHR